MAALPPTILSDDEEEVKELHIKGCDDRKKNVKMPKADDTEQGEGDDFSRVSSGDEMDDNFEFGGLLDDEEALGALSTTHSMNQFNNWSYKSALSLLSKNDSLGMEVERTSIANIIAAARSNLKRGVRTQNLSKTEGILGIESASSEESEFVASNETSKVCDQSGINDTDSDSSDDDVDDAQQANSMESDKLKEREGPNRKKRIDVSSTAKEVSIEEEDDSSDNYSSGDESEGDRDDLDEHDLIEQAKAAAYFDNAHQINQRNESIDSFSQLGLSRPLLRGVAAMGFVTPTPIQASVLPIAMAGRDVCASAVTGSGKTAAFLLPVMERILQRGGGRSYFGSEIKNRVNPLAATRALVLTPTRELAAQCVSMMTAMAKFTGLRCALIVGGAKNVMSQATELRNRPDVVVATPGRLLDHITNSKGVDLDDLEFLILDEADRLLDLGFQDEVHEIIKACPIERQSLLFSATMNTNVDELIKLSLKRPVRVQATDKRKKGTNNNTPGASVEVAPRLEQEFVRVRSGNEGVNREGMLLALLTRTFKTRVIVFFDTKSAAHRLMIICGLCGIKCTELHGNLTQVQRLEALESFREGSVDVLLATDLAARGLDIPGVETVINFEMPSKVDTYVHRIGRTARAGRGGKSCTLIGEGRRHLMKEVIKDAEEKFDQTTSRPLLSGNFAKSGIIRSRTIPQVVVTHFVDKINSLEQHVKDVLDAEAVAKMDRIAEMEAMRAKNLIEHSDEIKTRPRKEWFTTMKDRMSAKAVAAESKKSTEQKTYTGTHKMTRKKRRAQEAHAAMLEAQEAGRRESSEGERKSNKVVTLSSMKGAAKAAKRQEAQREKELSEKSIYDVNMERERKRQKNRKTKSNSDALGDAGLFSAEKVTFAKKAKKESPVKSSYTFHEFDPNKKRPVKSSYTFHEFDPNKKRPKKKKSHHSFKSKSKYKRK